MKCITKFVFVFLLIFFGFIAKSQTCGTCSINITSLDSNNYVVGSGSTLCIDTLGNFIGTITLNGGTICNKGLFNPSSFAISSGAINNYSNASFKTSLTLGSSAQLNNSLDAIINITGSLINNGGAVDNQGVINVGLDVQNNSGSFANSSVINCNSVSGSVSNTGIINVN
jgi:hypothetical protein